MALFSKKSAAADTAPKAKKAPANKADMTMLNEFFLKTLYANAHH